MNHAFSRRRFLAASAAMTLAGCASNNSNSNPDKNLGKGVHVAVIGAGYAGLSAANVLSDAGFRVTLLEARKRVGGRVNTLGDFIPNMIVEAGGDYFGANHPVANAYFKLLGLLPRNAGTMRPKLFLDGRVLSQEDAAPLLVEMDGALQTLFEPAITVNPDKPWETPGASALDAMSMFDWLEARKLSADAKIALRIYLQTENGVALERQSYLAMLSKITAGGGGKAYFTQSKMFRCATGNQSLAQALSLKLPGGRLMLDMPVASIANDKDGVVVGTADGWSERFDYAILAIPPSQWEKIKIEPGLPKELNPQLGSETVMLCAYSQAPWTTEGPYLSDTEFGMGFDATRGQVTMDDYAGVAIRSSGPAAVKLRESDPYYRDARLKNVLGRIYPGHREYYSGSRLIDWDTQPWTTAGRSFPAPGQFCTTGKLLQQPLGRLLIAGEHASLGFMGTMEGALASGVAAARQIAKQIEAK